MENVTFVYALATEQERQTEAVKKQQQNQLEKYRHVLFKGRKRRKELSCHLRKLNFFLDKKQR